MVPTIFDFNGVLVDDEAVHLAAFREVLRPLGIEVDDAAYADRYLGFDDAGAFRAMLTDAGHSPSDADIARLVEAKKPVYMERIGDALVVFDGAVDIVRRRARHGLVGIVSGALRHEIEHALGVMGVRDEIAFIVSADDTKRCKPDPEGYLLGMALLQERLAAREKLRNLFVIEDSVAGIQAAKSAFLSCAAVAHTYPADKLRAAGADVVAARLADLTDDMLGTSAGVDSR